MLKDDFYLVVEPKNLALIKLGRIQADFCLQGNRCLEVVIYTGLKVVFQKIKKVFVLLEKHHFIYSNCNFQMTFLFISVCVIKNLHFGMQFLLSAKKLYNWKENQFRKLQFQFRHFCIMIIFPEYVSKRDLICTPLLWNIYSKFYFITFLYSK